jgi:DNA-binding PadR family transcriptional regulator
MFGRRFAYEFEAADCDPWMEGRHHGRRHWRGHGWHGRRLLGWYMRRNPFGRGGPFGPGDPFAEEEGHSEFAGWGKRFFGRGDLKYALLELLQERPMHGYEMMKALQERTGGRYTPSAGSVYPTLQMLEDRGFVTVSEADGKKVYSITDDGRAFLAEGRQEERGPAGRRGPRHIPEEEWAEMAALVHNLRSTLPLLGNAWRSAAHDPKKIKRLRSLIEKLRAELETIDDEASEADD